MLKVSGSEIKGVILDMDGVLWRRDTLLCDLPLLFSRFKEYKIKVMMATNNGLRTVDQYIEKFLNFGAHIEDWQIMTSAIATGALLKEAFPKGGPIFIMGVKALHNTLSEFGFYHNNESPQAVAAGLTPELTYNMIKDTSLMIQTGIPFFFTNPDPTYPSPEGNIPGAGTVLAALETASGIKATLAGKPLPYSFEVSMKRMGTAPSETLVIGDRLSTDIQGGQASGCKTALVLTGIASKEDYMKWEPKPELLLHNIMDLFSL